MGLVGIGSYTDDRLSPSENRYYMVALSVP